MLKNSIYYIAIINILLVACTSDLGHVRNKQVHLLATHMYVGDGLVNNVISLLQILHWLKADQKQKMIKKLSDAPNKEKKNGLQNASLCLRRNT